MDKLCAHRAAPRWRFGGAPDELTEQFRVMAFAQLTWRESLRDIEVTLGANAIPEDRCNLMEYSVRQQEGVYTLLHLTDESLLEERLSGKRAWMMRDE